MATGSRTVSEGQKVLHPTTHPASAHLRDKHEAAVGLVGDVQLSEELVDLLHVVGDRVLTHLQAAGIHETSVR